MDRSWNDLGEDSVVNRRYYNPFRMKYPYPKTHFGLLYLAENGTLVSDRIGGSTDGSVSVMNTIFTAFTVFADCW